MTTRAELYDEQLEALRQKAIAEKMIEVGDYVGARNKLLKSQDFFPRDHIFPMLTVCDILSASTYHIPGCGIDYYRILCLGPLSTTQDVGLQYKKLLTFLEPIKESFSGTELALKFIEAAFLALSDSDKRAVFDLHRKRHWETHESPHGKALSLPKISDNRVGTLGGGSLKRKADSSESTVKRVELDWSKGHHGMSAIGAMPYFACKNEVDMVEVIDVDSPINQHNKISKEDPSSSSLTMAQKVLYQDFYNFDDERKIENMEEGQIWATRYQSNVLQNPRYAQIMTKFISQVTVMQLKPVLVSDHQRRWCEAGLPIACGSFSLDLSSGGMLSSPMNFSHKCTWAPGTTPEQFSIYPRKGEVWAVYDDWRLEGWSFNPEVVKSCKHKLVEILSHFSEATGSDCACLFKVQGFRSIFQRQTQEGSSTGGITHISPSMLHLLSHKVPAVRLTGKETDGVNNGMLEVDYLAVPNNMITRVYDRRRLKGDTSVSKADKMVISKPQNSSSSSLANNALLGKEVQGTAQLGNDIATGQVWALYFGKDSMPRRYVLIETVISRTQVRVTFLEPEPASALEINWKRKNLDIPCGTFRPGGTIAIVDISKLSHMVRFEKAMSKYRIYPAKGEIWAVYKGWNSKWERSDEEKSQFAIVEILSDFSEGDKIMVARLQEVKGFLTLFHRFQSNGFSLIGEISKTEILSFSHRISFCRITRFRLHGIPENSCQLEPNDLPPRMSKLI